VQGSLESLDADIHSITQEWEKISGLLALME
jgi:hypothetical protein